ncbi:PQQ-binding-like beta-propeller repeat protein [Kitasatospora sp. NPDC059795]|uniref:outer membrane protein assembly factor BamB family protein n=1 Tax=Kitasatospora sp. NPDC059795 TaxID=3346949 RepID=UPI003664CCA1
MSESSLRLEDSALGELLITADGFRATRAGQQRTGRVDAALIVRVLRELGEAPAPVADAAAPAVGRRLTVTGLNGREDRQWTDGSTVPVPAAVAPFATLLAQVFGEPGEAAALPGAVALGHPAAQAARSAAAVGTVAGRAAYALVEEDGSFGLTALDDAASLGGSDADAGLAPSAVALGEADGRSLFAVGGTDGSVQVWDATTGQVVHGSTGGEGAQAVAALICRDIPVAFSAGQGGDLRAVRADDGRVLGNLPTGGHGATVLRAAHCAGLDLLAAAAADGTVRVWDAATGEQLHLLVGHRGEVRTMAVLTIEDQAVLATAGHDRQVRIWDLATGQSVAELSGHTGTVTGLAFTTVDERPVLASCALDGTVRTWDVYDGRALHGWPAGGWLTALAAGDGVLYTGDETGRITAWDAATGAARSYGTPPGRPGTPLTALALGAPHGRPVLVAGFGDGVLVAWDAPTGSQLLELPADGGPVHSLDLTDGGPDGPLLVCGTTAGAVRSHRLADGTAHPLPVPHAGPVTGLAFTTGDQPLLASAGRDGMIAVRAAATGDNSRRFATGHGPITALAALVTGGQPILATAGEDLKVRMWHAGSGAAGPVCEGLARPAEVLSFAEIGGRPVLIAGSADGTVLVWDVQNGSRTAELAGGGAAVRAVVGREFDGEALLAAGDAAGTLRLWHLGSATLLNEAAVDGTPLAIELDETGVRIVTPGGAVTL